MMTIGVVTNLIIGGGLSTITRSLSWVHPCRFQGKRYFDKGAIMCLGRNLVLGNMIFDVHLNMVLTFSLDKS